MRGTITRLAPTVVLALLLGLACGGEDATDAGGGGGAPSGSATGSSNGGSGAAPAADGRLASVHRLADALPAEAGGMVRLSPVDGSENEKMLRALAKADYAPDAKAWGKSIRVEIEWLGKPLMGREKLGFGLYRATKTELSGLPAMEKAANAEDSENQLQVEVRPGLIVRASSEARSLDEVKAVVGALPLPELAKLGDDGTLFEPTAGDRAHDALMSKDEVLALLPESVDGAKAQATQGQHYEDALTFSTTGIAVYPGFGQVNLVDYGNEATAKRRAPADFDAMRQVVAWEKNESAKVERSSFEVDGIPVRLAVARTGGNLAQISARAAVGRFVLDYAAPWIPPEAGVSAEDAKRMGMRLFEDPADQVKTVLDAFPLEDLRKR